MRALTIRQPFAAAIALGLKTYETRPMSTPFRGEFAVVSAARVGRYEDDQHAWEIVARALDVDAHDLYLATKRHEDGGLPLGAAVAIAGIADVCTSDCPSLFHPVSDLDRRLGNWGPGRYGWKLDAVRTIDPVPATGQQGWWSIEI